MTRNTQLVSQHLENISSEALEKHQDIIRNYVRGREGIYALYEGNKLYYVGLARNLRNRLKQHLKDRHSGKWNRPCNRRAFERSCNMKLAFPFIASLLLSFLFAISARAQEPTATKTNDDSTGHVSWIVGPTGGYERVFYKTDPFPVLNSEPLSFLAQNGSGNGFYLGLSAEHNFLVPKHLYYLMELEYDSKPADFTMITSSPDTTVALWTQLSYYLLNLGLKYSFCADTLPRGFGLQLCVSIGIKNWADFWKSVEIGGSKVQDATLVSSAQALRIALRPELDYDCPLNKYWIFTPSIGYDVPLTQVDQPENWRASALFAGAAVRYTVW